MKMSQDMPQTAKTVPKKRDARDSGYVRGSNVLPTEIVASII